MIPKDKKNNVNLPQTPLALYIKLYCDRKGSSKSKYHNNLIEATKSYLSLTESEKQKFVKKLEECKHKKEAQFFEQLKSAKPYLKIKKDSSKCSDSTINSIENRALEEESSNCDSEGRPTVTPPLEPNCDMNVSNEIRDSEEPAINELEEDHDIPVVDPGNYEPPPPQPYLIEPIPPTIKNGHQLFYLLNSTEEGSSVSWSSLEGFERNRYSRAVSLLKKDYISKYKEYLESLSSKDLFDHYYKTVT